MGVGRQFAICNVPQFHSNAGTQQQVGVFMSTRRQFLQWTATAMSAPIAGTTDSSLTQSINSATTRSAAEPTGSDVGSLFPFIESQTQKVQFPLSYLQDEFKDLAEWKRQARGKLLELLHYAPPPCAADAQVVERVERDGLIQEKIYFS